MTTPNRPPLSPLAQAVVDAHYGAPAMTTPNRPPLWEAMRDAYDKAPMPPPVFRNCDDIGRHLIAAEIRAVAEWLVPEGDGMNLPPTGQAGEYHRWCERQRLRALLTTEADRAERGDG